MLIKCPECGKEISDKSKQCIHCGYPLEELNEEINTSRFFKIVMKESGASKVKVIKNIRELTGSEIADAKNIVDNTPSTVVSGLSMEEAMIIKEVFISNGSSVEICNDLDSTMPNQYIKGKNLRVMINSDQKQAVKVENPAPQVHCPYCQSTDVKRISAASKGISIIGFGIFSNKIGKQWHCNSCNSDF